MKKNLCLHFPVMCVKLFFYTIHQMLQCEGCLPYTKYVDSFEC